MRSDSLKRRNALNNIFWLFRIIWKYTPGYVLWTFAEGIIGGVHQASGVIYIQRLFDILGNNATFEKVVQIIVSYGIYLLFYWGFHSWYWQKYTPHKKEQLHAAMHSQMFRKAVLLDLANYEDPEFYNSYVWAMEKSTQHTVSLIEETGTLVSRTVSVLIVTGVLIRIDPLVASIIFIAAAVRVILLLDINKRYLKFAESVQPIDRKSGYIKRIFSLPDYAKDLRISGISDVLFDEYNRNVDSRIALLNNFGTKKATLNSLMQVTAIISEVAIIVLTLYNVIVTAKIGLGGLAASVNACWKMSWQLQDLANRILKYHEHGIFAERIIRFQKSKPTIQDGKLNADEFNSLALKSVKFSYTNDDKTRYVLNDISFEIRRGEKIAFVGYNGAGKTTLTKLIMRLYEATSGEVLYNGRNIKDYTIASLRNHIAAVFQDYRLFDCTIAENVVGGIYLSSNKASVNVALEQSTFFNSQRTCVLDSDTILGRELSSDGTKLSVGETQKIAIARAFYKDADLLILDEPSSALDPDAEYELNKAISEYCDNRTVIFISHRLSTTRHADRIYMFDHGTIIESGTHDELMSANGKYAYMFKLQASQYQAKQ